ncbi:unnamed protein product [Symbiodinium pilosum]|uniref:Uncharacterized protein n=1 Tax=Symbiodinium pilosum TaxID=2952 RepID=A0A812IY90_SYMPI|nr:unnamed protein product [Symbiodinium pilosum]
MIIAVIPAARYIIDDATGVNITLQTACLHICGSCNKLSEEGVPLRDPSTDALVMDLRAYVTGFRGDWKALKQTFNFARYADKDEVCWMCLATKGATADSLSMCYTNVNDDAPWLETMGVVPWEFTPAYAQLTGFQLTYIQPDILHCWHLGTGRDLAASALVFMVKGGLCFAGSTQAERLEGATIQLKEFCKERQLPLKLHKLSKSKLNWKSKAMPELRSSGYDTYVVVKWLTHVCERYSAVLPRDLCFALWAGNHVLSILSNAGRFLTPLEQSNKNTFGDAFMHAYVRLANESLPINLAGKVAILASTSLSQALLDSLRLSEEYKFAVMKSPAPEVPVVKGHATGEDAPMKVALQFVKAMEANGIEVTIAGSLARNVTEPRFTKDIDVNLRLGPGSVDKFVAAATAVGAELRSEIGRPRRGRGILTDDEVFLVIGIIYSGIPIDVFFNTWWGSQDAVDDAFLVEVDGQGWRFISPTSLCLFKILFLSESSPERVLLKHIEDIYALLEVSKIPVDRRYVSASSVQTTTQHRLSL